MENKMHPSPSSGPHLPSPSLARFRLPLSLRLQLREKVTSATSLTIYSSHTVSSCQRPLHVHITHPQLLTLPDPPTRPALPAMAAAPQQSIFPDSYVGFDTITQQIQKKSVKRGFQFNIICVGKLRSTRRTRAAG